MKLKTNFEHSFIIKIRIKYHCQEDVESTGVLLFEELLDDLSWIKCDIKVNPAYPWWVIPTSNHASNPRTIVLSDTAWNTAD